MSNPSKKLRCGVRPVFKPTILTADLRMPLNPIHRREFFDEPLEMALKKARLGSVSSGGSTFLYDVGMVSCDIRVVLFQGSFRTAARFVIDTLERLGAAKGSRLSMYCGAEARIFVFGVTEGLRVYVNKLDPLLDTRNVCCIYERLELNFASSELNRVLGSAGRTFGCENHGTQLAFFVYGKSIDAMQALLEPFLESVPLGKNSRIERIA